MQPSVGKSFHCGQCGGPLAPQPWEVRTECTYCHALTRVRHAPDRYEAPEGVRMKQRGLELSGAAWMVVIATLCTIGAFVF